MNRVRRAGWLLLLALGLSTPGAAQTLAPELRQFVSVDAPTVALTHARVIDGTGAPAREDQTVVIAAGRIAAIGPGPAMTIPAGAKVLDLSGKTVTPGLVGMHDHLFFPQGGAFYGEMGASFPRLYLAAGVTTIRTTGSIEPYSDLEIQKLIDAGKAIGPKMRVTGPYLEGNGAFTAQMHVLTGPEDATRLVDYWADQGVTSFKAYMNITRDELSAAVVAAHRRTLKVTGHLCSVTYPEAIALGIDDLEHGPIYTDTEFTPNKIAGACPEGRETLAANVRLDVQGAPVQGLIRNLVEHHVAITSTLPVFELLVPGRPPLQQRVLDAMSQQARLNYLERRARSGSSTSGPPPQWEALFHKEMEFEHAFAKAGGLLLAGPDPTGIGGVVAGFGDQREVELLVEAGFTPVEAIHIASSNGAEYLGEADRVGTLSPGKQADLVVIQGDPSTNIADIEKVETVFKDGVGYDSARLIDSVRGLVGSR